MKDFLENNPLLIYILHVVFLGIIMLFSWLLLSDTGMFTRTTKQQSASTAPYTEAAQEPASAQKPLETYLRVTGGCGIHYSGVCVHVHSGPDTNFPVIAQLRNDIVLKVGESQVTDGHTWYKIVFDEGLRYPDRVKSAWYVAQDGVEVFTDVGVSTSTGLEATSTKKIVVSRSKQTLTAYDGDMVFMKAAVSTGLLLTPTPRGTFTIFRKTPTRYMQGPIPEANLSQYYDLPGVPWNLYFTEQGAVIHGAYWHDSFGKPYSHGCVNLLPEEAERLYYWAEVGVPVVIQD